MLPQCELGQLAQILGRYVPRQNFILNYIAILCYLAKYCIATDKWKRNARPTTLIKMDVHLLLFSPDIQY